MAEGVGFEPTVRFHAQRFSRPSQSTTLPPFRDVLAVFAGAMHHSADLVKRHSRSVAGFSLIQQRFHFRKMYVELVSV